MVVIKQWINFTKKCALVTAKVQTCFTAIVNYAGTNELNNTLNANTSYVYPDQLEHASIPWPSRIIDRPSIAPAVVNTITWPNNDWYKVQSSSTFETIAQGQGSVEVPNGTYQDQLRYCIRQGCWQTSCCRWCWHRQYIRICRIEKNSRTWILDYSGLKHFSKESKCTKRKHPLMDNYMNNGTAFTRQIIVISMT